MPDPYDGPSNGPVGVRKPKPDPQKPQVDPAGQKFADAVKNNPLIKVAGGIANAPVAVVKTADKIGKFAKRMFK